MPLIPELIRILVEVGFLWALIYVLLRFLRGTQGKAIVTGVTAVFFPLLLVFSCFHVWPDLPRGFPHIGFVIDNLGLLFGLGFIVILQPELRQVLTNLGLRRRRFGETKGELLRLGEIVLACQRLAEAGHGALIVLERGVGLRTVTEGAFNMDAPVRAELLESIFQPTSPLHDGAVVIRKDRIIAARCILPLSNSLDLGPDLGTRHRAAVGLSERTDAVVIVVSEERGTLSIAVADGIDMGMDHRGLRPEVLRGKLVELLARKAELGTPELPAEPKLEIEQGTRRLVLARAKADRASRVRDALVALLLAVLSWYYVDFKISAEQLLPVRLPQTIVAPAHPPKLASCRFEWSDHDRGEASAVLVNMTLVGPKQVIAGLGGQGYDYDVTGHLSKLDAGDLDRIRRSNWLYELRPSLEDVGNLPDGLTLEKVEPQVLEIRVKPTVTTTVTTAMGNGPPESRGSLQVSFQEQQGEFQVRIIDAETPPPAGAALVADTRSYQPPTWAPGRTEVLLRDLPSLWVRYASGEIRQAELLSANPDRILMVVQEQREKRIVDVPLWIRNSAVAQAKTPNREIPCTFSFPANQKQAEEALKAASDSDLLVVVSLPTVKPPGVPEDQLPVSYTIKRRVEDPRTELVGHLVGLDIAGLAGLDVRFEDFEGLNSIGVEWK